MESNAAGLVLRPALKTGFSEMGWGSTPLLSAKYSFVVKWYNNRLITGHYKFDSCRRNQFISRWTSGLGQQPFTLPRRVRFPSAIPLKETVMANVKKGNLTAPPQWWKHLKDWKRVFWKSERQAQKRNINKGE